MRTDVILAVERFLRQNHPANWIQRIVNVRGTRRYIILGVEEVVLTDREHSALLNRMRGDTHPVCSGRVEAVSADALRRNRMRAIAARSDP